MFLPSDIQLNYQAMVATGIFIPPSLNSQMTTDDFQIIYKNGNAVPKTSFFFNGCNDLNTLGGSPFGSLLIENIST